MEADNLSDGTGPIPRVSDSCLPISGALATGRRQAGSRALKGHKSSAPKAGRWDSGQRSPRDERGFLNAPAKSIVLKENETRGSERLEAANHPGRPALTARVA